MKKERIREDSVKYFVFRNSTSDIESSQTKKNYKRWSTYFADFCKTEGITTCTFKQNPEGIVKEYSDFLLQKGCSPHTIHSYIAPVCKSVGLNMKEIDKPRRTARTIVRGRDLDRNVRGKLEEEDAKFKNSVDFQKIVGVRRAELSKFAKKDLLYDKEVGMYCLHLYRGKGGKEQYQYILPKYNQDILRMFKAIDGADGKFVRKDELGPHINYHKMRADVAKEAYEYYKSELSDPDKRAAMFEKLRKHYLQMHRNGSDGLSERDKRHYEKFCREIELNDTYKLRGEVRANAIKHGQPVEYDRLAMSCVSVFHLSHWRNDVTAKNYLS